MTTAIETMRAKMHDQAQEVKTKRGKKVWSPPDPFKFRHRTVLAFDQTLTHLGWAIVRSSVYELSVIYGGSVDVKSDRDSFWGTLDKADKIEREVISLLTSMAGSSVDDIVCEMPSVQGYRLESSLMAMREIHRCVKELDRGDDLHLVSNRSMRALLNPPNERNEKKYVRQAVEALIPSDHRHTTRWNEHVHDAVGLALTHLYDKDAQ